MMGEPRKKREWTIVNRLSTHLWNYLRFAIFAVALVPHTFAAFEDTTTGARAASLGEAYVAIKGDPSTLFYNPAALARLDYKEVTSEYSRLYAGLSDASNLSQFFLGYAHPINCSHVVAVGVRQFSLDQLYKERAISIGYAYTFDDRISLGGAIKQLYHSVSDPGVIVDSAGNLLDASGTAPFFTQNKTSQNNYTGDIGLLYRATDRLTLGLSVRDLTQPNIAFAPDDEDRVTRKYDAGVSYEMSNGLSLAGQADVHDGLPGQTDFFWVSALEQRVTLDLEKSLALRASLANGSRRFHRLGFGLGFRWHAASIDYAFIMNLSGPTFGTNAGTHRFSVSYRFGEARVCEKQAIENTQYLEPVLDFSTVESSQTIPVVVVPPPPPPPPAAPVLSNDLKVSLSSQFLFASGSSKLSRRAYRQLNEVVSLLKTYPKNNVVIEGHTDSRGKPAVNLRLSKRRAQAVMQYVMNKGKFSSARFKVVGYGSKRPVESNRTSEGRAMNRRVEITVLKVK